MDLISVVKLKLKGLKVGSRPEFNGKEFVPTEPADIFELVPELGVVSVDLRHGNNHVIKMNNFNGIMPFNASHAVAGNSYNFLFMQGEVPSQIQLNKTTFKTPSGVNLGLTVKPNAIDLLSGVCMKDGEIKLFKIAELG
jgi:hypothetical protein